MVFNSCQYTACLGFISSGDNQTMVLTKWTQEMTTKFISLYQEEECLWRIDSLAYRDKDARDTALRNIIDGMNLKNLTIDDVKKKIKYLRSTYMTEINKIEKNLRSGDGRSKIYKPCLTWFDQMDAFIKHVNVKRNTQSSAMTQPNTNNPDTDSDDQAVSDTNKETASNSVETDQQIEDTNRKQRDQNNKPSKRRADVKADATNEIPKKIDSDRPSQTINKRSRLSQLRRNMQEISAKLNRVEDTNEFEIYGKYVGVQLKSMNEEDAILAQQEIQTVLTRFKLKKVHRDRHISETPSTPHSHVSDDQYLVSPTDADSNNQSRRSSHDGNDAIYDHNYSANQCSDESHVNETADVSAVGLQCPGVQCNVEIIEDGPPWLKQT